MNLEGQESNLRPVRWRRSTSAWPVAMAEVVQTWAARWRTRRHMSRLSDHMLRDIGLARADMEREVTKAFWRK